MGRCQDVPRRYQDAGADWVAKAGTSAHLPKLPHRPKRLVLSTVPFVMPEECDPSGGWRRFRKPAQRQKSLPIRFVLNASHPPCAALCSEIDRPTFPQPAPLSTGTGRFNQSPTLAGGSSRERMREGCSMAKRQTRARRSFTPKQPFGCGRLATGGRPGGEGPGSDPDRPAGVGLPRRMWTPRRHLLRRGLHAWKSSPQSARAQADALAVEIAATHDGTRKRYGSRPRIHRALRKKGVRVGEKRVARLMPSTSTNVLQRSG